MATSDVSMQFAGDPEDSNHTTISRSKSSIGTVRMGGKTLTSSSDCHRGHRHASSTSSYSTGSSSLDATPVASVKSHRRRFSIQSASISSSSNTGRAHSRCHQNNNNNNNGRLSHHQHPHTRAQSATAALSGPSPSFFKRIFKVFVGGNGNGTDQQRQQQLQNGFIPRLSKVHPLDGNSGGGGVAGFAGSLPGSPMRIDEDPNESSSETQTDESGSCEECECNCDNVNINRMTMHISGLPPAYGQQSNSSATAGSSSRQHNKKRSNSTVTTSSVASDSSRNGRSTKSIRPGGRAGSISSDVAGPSDGMGGRRSSVTSSIAGESIHYDLGYNKNRMTSKNTQQYRQHFTGHGPLPVGTSTMNGNQQEAMKRRLSFFKSIAAGGGSSSRRGSAFSTKSQETAVNLTGINPADEFDEEAEYEEEDEDIDLELDEDEDDNEDDIDDYNDLNDYYDDNEKIMLQEQGQDYYATHDSMLTSDVELDLHARHLQNRAAHLSPRRLRQMRHLRRQSLLSDKNNNMVFRNKAAHGGCTICPPPLLECDQRPSPIQLPEILHLIFQFVVDMTPQEDYSQREIYNCLLVSKQWYLVAQKTLWREIRFKNPTKLELFIDLLKRTDTVECLGIEKNTTEVATSQQQSQSRPRHSRVTAHNEDQSIMAPIAMQKRLHERASAVKKIVLHKLKLIEDQDIMPLTSWFHNLQILEFYICEKLTDKIVMAVAENCPQLQQLLMPGCAKVTDQGIRQVAMHCPRMKHLDLRACSNVSDESLILVAKHCPDLWHLNVGRVSSAAKVTGKSIVEIAKNTNLNTLGLAGCAMTDDAVIEIARYSRAGLHRISLNSCPMLTSTSIRALMQLCPNLAVLEIKQCLLVTDMATLYRFSTRRVLVELCPELQKRLLEYKVELAAMNASIQNNNIASTQMQTTITSSTTNHHLNGQSTTQAAMTTGGYNDNEPSTPQQTTTTVVSHP